MEKREKYIISISLSIIFISFIMFVLLFIFDKESTLSEIVIASCTVGLLIVSIYGIVYQLSVLIYNKNK